MVVSPMNDEIVSLREAKAQLSELTERAANGVDVVIAKHGRPAARLTAARSARKRVDLAALRNLTGAQPRQSESAGRAVRRLRDAARY
jgi:prevent-host-death family protein